MGEITNAELYDAIERMQDRMAKLETKVSYLFGALAVGSGFVAFIEIVAHHS